MLIPALVLALMAAGSVSASAQTLISRTITIDGNMSDWLAGPAVPNNSGQFSTDCEKGEGCENDNPQSTGRDLKKFAFTWDNAFLYFYVERYASASNTTDWLFYLDEDADGRMEDGERVFHVDWQGSNRSTDAELCVYNAVNNSIGDALAGDGQAMPGTVGSCTNLYSGTGGSTSGVEMESRVSWAQLGKAGPANIRFHISSSRNLNLPGGVEDNMDGPGGGTGQLFPPDMSVGMATSAPTVSNMQTITLTVTLTNVYYTPFSGINVNVTIPSQMTYLSHSAPAGTSFVDTNSDGRPDRWQVTSLASQQVRQLQIQVRGTALPVSSALSTAASLGSWTGTDSQAGNNSASVNYTLLPSPALTLSQSASGPVVVPGDTVIYTVLTTNPAHAPADSVVVHGDVNPNLMFSLDSFGAGVPFQFVNGSSASGLAMGTPEYSADGGTSWSYMPVSGGGGAPAGFDANVTNWRIRMSGTMQSHGAMFEIIYAARVR